MEDSQRGLLDLYLGNIRNLNIILFYRNPIFLRGL